MRLVEEKGVWINRQLMNVHEKSPDEVNAIKTVFHNMGRDHFIEHFESSLQTPLEFENCCGQLLLDEVLDERTAQGDYRIHEVMELKKQSIQKMISYCGQAKAKWRVEDGHRMQVEGYPPAFSTTLAHKGQYSLPEVMGALQQSFSPEDQVTAGAVAATETIKKVGGHTDGTAR